MMYQNSLHCLNVIKYTTYVYAGSIPHYIV